MNNKTQIQGRNLRKPSDIIYYIIKNHSNKNHYLSRYYDIIS